MRQTTITGQIKKRLDLIYAHELDEGDVFCKSMADFRKGLTSEVTYFGFESNGMGEFSGKIEFNYSGYNKKKDTSIKKSMEIKDPKQQVIFLKQQ